MKKFVNRIEELNYLKKSCETIAGRKLIIIYGNTGLGKSELVKRFLCDFKEYPAVKVPISGKSEFKSGHYIKKIKEKSNTPINNVSFKNNENDYILKQYKTKFALKVLFNIIEVIPILKDFFQICSKSYKEYCEMKDSLKHSSSKKELIELEEYLRYLYKETPFILNIENIQSMDELSWNTLYDILCEIDSFSLIFEYTLNDENINLQLKEVIEKYSSIINPEDIHTYEIVKLDNKHVLSIDDALSPDFKQHLEKELGNWSGNLKEIENYIILKRYAHKPIITNNMHVIISLLEEEPLKWMMRIYTAPDELPLSLLKRLGLSEKHYNKLLGDRLIKSEDGKVSTDHDTICDVLKDERYTNLKKSSLEYWASYYKDRYSAERSSNDLYNLIYFIVLLDDINELNKILGIINHNIKVAAEPKEYLKRIERLYYENIIKSPNNIATDELLFWLVEIYQNLGDYKKAYSLLNNVSNTNIARFKVLKALLLYQAGFQENAVEFCTELIESNTIDAHMELFLRIIRLDSYYTLEQYKKTNSEYYYIERHSEKFEKYLEYGFFLRNAELVKTPSEAISDFKKSIAHFEKFNAKKQAISSRINLAVAYGLLGEFDKACTQLDIAYSKKEEFIGLYDMILNNQAVLLHYKGISRKTKDKLLLAQKYASYDFNKLAICNNLLVYNIRTGTVDDMLVEDILALIKNRTFKNKRIICFSYINLYKYYQNRNENLASKYYDKIFESTPVPYYISEWLSKPTLSPDDPEYYRTRVGWPLNYLNEWSIEYDSSLMHF